MMNEILLETSEKVVRKVTPSGNGAHIFAPKEWLDEEVLLVRISRIDIKKGIYKLLEPYMGNIVSVILFGSYARGEQNENSDVDVLIISNKPFKIKKKGMDIIVIDKDKLEKAIKLNPILIYSAINEGVPLINSSFIYELKSRKMNINAFNEFIISSKENLKSNKEIIELDKLQGLEYVSESVIYSLFLRLRGVFIMNCLLNHRKYSNNLFKDWLYHKINILKYELFYSIYISVRDNKKIREKIPIKIAESLNELLEKELKGIVLK